MINLTKRTLWSVIYGRLTTLVARIKCNEMSSLTAKVNGKEVNPEFSFEPNDILKDDNGTYRIVKNGRSYKIVVLEHYPKSKKLELLVNGNKYNVQLEDDYDRLLKSLGIEAGGTKKVKNFKAPMPGLVLNIMVESGQQVTKDDPLLILEAMKMENVLKSPGDGVVKSVEVSQGLAVDKNQILINFE